MPTPSAAYSMLQKHGEKIDRLHKSDLYQVQKSFVIWIFTFLTSKCRWWDPLGRNMSFMLATSLKGVKLESLTFPWQMNAAKKNSSNVWFGGREITSSTGIAGLRSLQPTSKQAKVCNCFSKNMFFSLFSLDDNSSAKSKALKSVSKSLTLPKSNSKKKPVGMDFKFSFK